MDEKRDRDGGRERGGGSTMPPAKDAGAANVEVDPPRCRQVWEKPTVELVDVRLTKHHNAAAPDGVFSLS
jgi:hypothetical protein